MNGLAWTPSKFRSAWLLGLWGAVTWSVLRLHDAPLAREHSIRGPWGFGPTIPALLAAHGFWLLVAIPGALLAGRWLSKGRANALGWTCLGLGALGLIVVSLGAWTSRPEVDHPGARAYTAERILFAVATTVDVPIIPVALAGIVLLSLGRRRSRAAGPGPGTTDGPEDGCDSLLCDLPAPRLGVRAAGRIEVGKPFPELTLLGRDGKTLAVPADLAGRASILYFMRAAGCSICRGHVRALVGIHDRLPDPKPRVVVVHPGNDAASRALAGKFQAPFTFASGRARGVYAMLGVSDRSFGLFRGSGTILLDDLGVVRHARLGILPHGAFSEPELLNAHQLLGEDPAVGPLEEQETPHGGARAVPVPLGRDPFDRVTI